MKLTIPKEIRWLSLGFALIFFGFDGVQQYVTIYFKNNGHVRAGFFSLVLIYASFMLANWWTPKIIGWLGGKTSLLLTYWAYSVYCFGLLSKTYYLIYGLSILIGLAAGLLWTAQNSYLVRVSKRTQFGKNAGFFGSSFAIGAGLGVLIMGLLIPTIGAETAFAIFAGIILLSGLAFLRLKDVRGQSYTHSNLAKILKSNTAVRYSMLWLSFNFVQGLVVGIVPLKIDRIIGISAVGPLIALFFISPILLSYIIGKLSDDTGRRVWTILMLVLCILGLLILTIAHSAFLLIVGIIVLALNFGISRTVTLALVGDLVSGDNIESFSALVWAVQAGSTLLALILSTLLIDNESIYVAGLIITVLSACVVLPLALQPLNSIRTRISIETK